MKENSISYKTAKQEVERLVCEIEEVTITHRAYTAECLRRVLKENEELDNDNVKWRANYVIQLAKIDNLEKENEELKKFITEGIIIEPHSTYENYQLNFLRENFISVQKIKEKIEYLDNQQKQWLEDRELKASDGEITFARDVLQELLEGRK